MYAGVFSTDCYIYVMDSTRPILLAVALLILTGCGGTDTAPISPDMAPVFDEQVDVELVVRARGNAMEYLDTRIQAPAGSRARLVMDNTETSSAAMIHNVVVIQADSEVDRVALAAQGAPGNIPDDPAVLLYTPQAQPREKTAVVFTMPSAGEYPYICTYPGHFQAMRGVLISTPS